MLEAASAQSQRNYQISALVFISMIIVCGDLHQQCAVVDAQDDCSTTGHYR